MNLFCFASRNEENIWRGFKARKWAVARVSDSAMRGRITKARKFMRIGSKGILYCGPKHSFTVPFIVASDVDTRAVVTDVWPEPWVLPFAIEPLGSPSKHVPKESAILRWPVLQLSAHMNVTAAMNLTGATVFVPKDITDEDWRLILEDLGG